MNSNEIIFQLTNVGSSPIQKSDVLFNSISNTSPPRRWTELFSKKKVKTPATSSPSTIRSSYSSYNQTSPTLYHNPLSSSSASDCFPVLSQDLNYSSISRPSKANGKCWKNEPCCICSDLCRLKGSVERVVQLQCMHMCHEDCLIVGIDIAGRFNDHHDILPHALPKCSFCQVACIPRDHETNDKIRTHFLNMKSVSKVPTKPELAATPTVSKISGQALQLVDTKPTFSASPIIRDINVDRYNKRRSTFRGSTISAVSSIVSSSSRPEKTSPPLHVQIQYFLQSIFSSFSNLDPKEFESKYGLLRLVDDFFVSFGSFGNFFEHYICYMFPEYMIVCKPVASELMPFTHFSAFKIFQLKKPASINLLDAETLEVNFLNDESLKMKQYGGNSEPLEKWITAFYDPLLSFGKCDFTSIKMPDFLLAVDQSNSWGSTTVGSKDKNIEKKLASIHESNVLTSISSIISLRKSKPEELVVILQIDRRKIDETDLHTIKNLLRVIHWKFTTVHCCQVDEKKNIVRIDNLLRIIDSLHEANVKRYKFSPNFLYDHIYGPQGHRCQNTGVLVVSNSSMESKTSCIFENYDSFANFGRRHVHDLKIKVGFSNQVYNEIIQDLVEIENWDGLMEVITYAFNLSFEDSNEESDSEGTDSESYFVSQNDKLSFRNTPKVRTSIISHVASESARVQSRRSPKKPQNREYYKNESTYQYL